MQYVSSRNSATKADFETVVLSGVAEDGGLYMPSAPPEFSAQEIANWSMLTYDELAFRVIKPFVGQTIPEEDLKQLLKDAYSEFDHRTIAPLQQVDRNEWVLELFHGPTRSSKDFSAQLQVRFVEYFLAKRKRRALIVGATNGDTGLAAIEAFKNSQSSVVVAFFPESGSPDEQIMRLHASDHPNLYRFAVNGSFDDCQMIVSKLFRNWQSNYTAVSFNSSNWVNVMAQLVFYFYATLQLSGGQRTIGFSVPASSFSEVYAGYIAQKMGLPITQMIVATNRNDALHQLFLKNHYSRIKSDRSLSPAMDLSVFSNLERLLWELYGKDSVAVSKLMEEFEENGEMVTDNKLWLQARMIIDSYSVSDEETLAEIKSMHHDTGYIIDPHTATGVLAARLYRRSMVAPMVTLGEVSPIKSAILLAKLGIVPIPKVTPVQSSCSLRLYRINPDDVGTINQVLSSI